MPAPAAIDWTMTKDSDGKALRIEYRVTNTWDKRIYLSDLVPTHTDAGWTLTDPQPIAVLNDDEPGVVRFARGRVGSDAPLTVPPMDPGARAIDPGQTVQGNARVPLPLAATPYVGTVAPLRGKPTAAHIELGFLRGDGHWSQLPLTDGSFLTLSHAVDRMEALRSEKKAIP